MNCTSAPESNPVELFTALFPTVADAAAAAGVSPQMLFRMRRRGFVSTRDRAVRMAEASQGRVSAAQLLAVDAVEAA